MNDSESPDPSKLAQPNTAMASTMPSSQLRARPKRGTRRNHSSGTDSAAQTKYMPRNAGAKFDGACNRSCTKKSTSVAGMALAMPFSMNTVRSRRNAGWRHGDGTARGVASDAVALGAGVTGAE